MNSARRLNERLAGRFNYLYGSDDGSGGDAPALGGAGSVSGGSASSSTVSSSLSLAAADSGFGDDALPSPPSEQQQPPPVSVKKLKETISKREAFFKSDAPATKFDVASRERDGKAEKDRPPTAQVPPQMQQQPTVYVSSVVHESDGPAKHRLLVGAPSSGSGGSVATGLVGQQAQPGSKELDGYVGFANLPNQVYRKAVKRGFEFSLMVVGESGLGKSTLINSLFLSELYSGDYPGPSERIKKTVQVDTSQVLLKEGGVQLKLTVVDTPGFGDAVDNSNCWQPIINYIDSKYDEYLNAESKMNRRVMPDNRVHCCLYFIAPRGHGLKPLDIEIMKRLHEKVNVIPLIAKADTMMPDECKEFKKKILNEIAQHKIRIYEFPDVDDDEENKVLKKLKERVPFAVVGSNRVIEQGDKKVRGRQYPWGVVEVENLEHNDFLALRDMIIRTHMQDLKDVTNNVHYENFRYNKLAAAVSPSPQGSGAQPSLTVAKDPISQMEEEKREHEVRIKKMEAEMEQVFESKVREKVQKLRDSEADIERRSEQMKKNLEQQEAEMAERRRQFEAEKAAWEEQFRGKENGSNGDVATPESTKSKKKGLF